MKTAIKAAPASRAMAGEKTTLRDVHVKAHTHTHTHTHTLTLGSKAAETTLKICTIFKYCIYRNKHTSLFVTPGFKRFKWAGGILSTCNNLKHKQIKATIKRI